MNLSPATMALAASVAVMETEGCSVRIPPPPTTTTTSTQTTSSVIAGLNGALQKRFILSSDRRLIPGNVHRATTVQVGVGGKGQDVAIALSCLQYSEPIQLAQFIGKDAAGDTLYNLLQQTLSRRGGGGDDDARRLDDENNDYEDKDGMFACTVRSESSMRTCTSIVAADMTTELVEPSGTISPLEYQELLNRLAQIPLVVDTLCIMGSLPPGCPDDTYARIYETLLHKPQLLEDEKGDRLLTNRPLPPQRFSCLIDSAVGLESLLRTIRDQKNAAMAEVVVVTKETATTTTGTTRTPQTLLKINASELCRLAGIERKVVAETSGIAVEELCSAVRMFFQKWPHARDALDAMAISDGSHPSYFVTVAPITSDQTSASANRHGGGGDVMEIYQISIPALRNTIIYPIGAGDAVAAGTLAAWKALSLMFSSLLLSSSRSGMNNDSPSIIPLPLQEQLSREVEWKMNETTLGTSILLTSFQFGLACGTASCLQESNSVLILSDVEHFFQLIMKQNPTLVSKETITSSKS